MDVLNCRVLVLNKSYTAIDIISVKKALIKLVKNTAEVVDIENKKYLTYDFSDWIEMSLLKRELNEYDVDDDFLVSTESLAILAPRVIRYVEYNDIPKRKVKLNRRNVFKRDEYICQYCGEKFTVKELTIDHIRPKSKDGKESWNNLVTCCFKCNQKKRDLDLHDTNMKLLKKPKEPKYSSKFHVEINESKYMTWKNFVSEVYWTTKLS